ncbi:MAG: DUF1326 domain-containing protein [Armatimonadetes bacterium]|nr:DUF1326 domain-containing protein [Armatimonadota bacterium]
MKTIFLGVAALSVALCAGRASAAPAVTGDYVESRSANVYVGACHHEGELLTAGRNALLAWNITGGEFQGVSLTGVRAVAMVVADRNLELADARRRSVLYLSDSASPAQQAALTALLRDRAGKALGEVLAVRVAPVQFDASGDLYRVHVPGAALMKIRKATQQLCCKQPYEVWGKPFVPVAAAKTGYCIGTEYRDNGLLESWSATEQNNAFHGQFTL